MTGCGCAHSRQEHFQLAFRCILRFIQNYECIVQGPSAHKCQRSDLDHLLFDKNFQLFMRDHIAQGII